MKITINGCRQEVRSTTLADALAECGFENPAISTALNGAFVSKAARADQALAEGDRIEVLAPMQGG